MDSVGHAAAGELLSSFLAHDSGICSGGGGGLELSYGSDVGVEVVVMLKFRW